MKSQTAKKCPFFDQLLEPKNIEKVKTRLKKSKFIDLALYAIPAREQLNGMMLREAYTNLQTKTCFWIMTLFKFDNVIDNYKITDANLVPLPVQKPHPPIHIAATRTKATQDFVAGSGHPLLVGVVLDTADAIGLCHTMVNLAKEKGQVMGMGQIPFFRYFYVAETEEQARADSKPALDWNIDMIQWRRTFDTGSEVWEKMEDFRNTRTELPPSYDYLYENRAFIGTPDQVIAKIKALQDQGVELFGCNFSFGGMPQDKVLKSMRLFAKEVMPVFK